MSDGTLAEWGTEATQDEKIFAAVAHALMFIFPVFGPLVVWFIKKDNSRYVAYHAMQATVFQVAIWVITGITCGFGFILTLVGLWGAWRAWQGQWDGYPLIGGIGK